MSILSERPLVSVAMTTFNHEPWIHESIESVLAQRTSFRFELVIGEDCSSDGTRGVVADLAAAHPDRITAVLPERNLGRNGMPLFIRVLDHVRGRYVASMDGDDFWTSPSKLEKQVRFLEEHPECAFCFHNVATMLPDGTICPDLYTRTGYPPVSTITELWDGNPVPACSPMFRRKTIASMPAWYSDSRFGDWALNIIAAEHGRLGYLDEVLGIYRMHGRGLWSGLNRVQQLDAVIEFLKQIDSNLGRRYARDIARSVSKLRDELARILAEA